MGEPPAAMPRRPRPVLLTALVALGVAACSRGAEPPAPGGPRGEPDGSREPAAWPVYTDPGVHPGDGVPSPTGAALLERAASAEDDLPTRILAEPDDPTRHPAVVPPPPDPGAAEVKAPERVSPRYFTHYGANPTIDTRETPFSTFGIDVDTAGYVLARTHLDRGELPPESAVRVEEVVNYFDYHYPPPDDGVFSLHAEIVPSPHRTGYHVLHLGVQGKEIAAAERPPANLVLVIDVSGSMGSQGRLPLVKDALRLLVAQLRARDSVAIVAYGSTARVVLPPTPGSDHATIISAVDELHTEGSTNVEAGLRLGYELAARHQNGAATNRVVLCSDGVANTGATTADAILRQVSEQAARGITLTTIGVGMGDYNDTLMEQLANKGNGSYAYVDDRAEARRVFVDHLTGTLQVIAKDVKIRVELDPTAVARYRLLGYENRGLARSDFDDDRKDAGELGAGHSVTALYEIKLLPGEHARLGRLRVRYKTPRSESSTELERDLPMELVRASWRDAAPPTQLSVVAAAYAEKLRGSYWVRNLAWADVQRLYAEIDVALRADPDVRELGRLIDRAASLDRRGDKFERDLPLEQMDFDTVPVLR
jgi:Ca-activated chloride channel homolog